MKVIAINASPRKGWNTDLLVKEAARGAAESGADIEYVDLYRLEKFTGCISCFGCMKAPNEGRCVCNDGLHGTLEKIRDADALIIGSPFYFGDMTAGFRALYERLMFQYLTYNAEVACCNKRKIPVLILASGNGDEQAFKQFGMESTMENYKNMLSAFIGPTEYLYAADTLQVNDYSQYNWTVFDPASKVKSRKEQFPLDLQRAYEAGRNIL